MQQPQMPQFDHAESEKILQIFEKFQDDLMDIRKRAKKAGDLKTEFDATVEYYKVDMSAIKEATTARLMTDQENKMKEMQEKLAAEEKRQQEAKAVEPVLEWEAVPAETPTDSFNILPK